MNKYLTDDHSEGAIFGIKTFNLFSFCADVPNFAKKVQWYLSKKLSDQLNFLSAIFDKKFSLPMCDCRFVLPNENGCKWRYCKTVYGPLAMNIYREIMTFRGVDPREIMKTNIFTFVDFTNVRPKYLNYSTNSDSSIYNPSSPQFYPTQLKDTTDSSEDTDWTEDARECAKRIKTEFFD